MPPVVIAVAYAAAVATTAAWIMAVVTTISPSFNYRRRDPLTSNLQTEAQ